MRHLHRLVVLAALAPLATSLPAQLFAGVDVFTNIRSSTLVGFPNVSYAANTLFQVNGMAGMDDGRTLVLATGAFTTDLYTSVLGGAAQLRVRPSVDLHGLAYGRGRLYGFTNFTNPLGVRAIDLNTGANTVVADTSAAGYRFFGLDYNATDDSLYGYTEYGSVTGLYRIDIDTGACSYVAPSIPAINSQGRGLACANHTVYLTGTRGQDGVPFYAYDLRQGQNGSWVSFTNPFTTTNATGGSTFLEVRQQNLLYRGEGRVTLSCTGQALQSGRTATFRIHSDRPNAVGFLLLSTAMTPSYVPQLNSTLIQWPPMSVSQLNLGSNGMLEVPIAGGSGPASFYLQYVMVDPTTSSRWAVSNGLRIDFLP